MENPTEKTQAVPLRSDDLFGEIVRKHNLAVESLTEQQLVEVIRQAIASGDIMRNVTNDGSAQAITYIPYREVSRLRDQNHKLSHEVARLTRELDEAQRQINMDTVRTREMQDAGMKLEFELEQLRKHLETCWNCGEERVCKETSLGPVCSHECAEQLFSKDVDSGSGSAFAGHTPGPWQIYTGSDADRARKDGFVLVVAGDQSGRIVANVNAESCPDTYSVPAFVQMPVEANARLIAAAPDLLRVLTRLHAAVSARMGADEPTGEQRLELFKAWEEAGRLLSQNIQSEPRSQQNNP